MHETKIKYIETKKYETKENHNQKGNTNNAER